MTPVEGEDRHEKCAENRSERGIHIWVCAQPLKSVTKECYHTKVLTLKPEGGFTLTNSYEPKVNKVSSYLNITSWLNEARNTTSSYLRCLAYSK